MSQTPEWDDQGELERMFREMNPPSLVPANPTDAALRRAEAIIFDPKTTPEQIDQLIASVEATGDGLLLALVRRTLSTQRLKSDPWGGTLGRSLPKGGTPSHERS